jgi:hypothetical protein
MAPDGAPESRSRGPAGTASRRWLREHPEHPLARPHPEIERLVAGQAPCATKLFNLELIARQHLPIGSGGAGPFFESTLPRAIRVSVVYIVALARWNGLTAAAPTPWRFWVRVVT